MASYSPSLRSLLLFVLTASSSLAAPTASAQAACSDIKSALPGKLWLPGEAAYTKENKDYYNIGLAELGPACIAMPTSPEEVSQVVKILNTRSDVKFAVKSGGHSPNPGQSSIKDGILIALRNINGTELDKAKGVAYVKPGGHWSNVIQPLDKQGYTVVSGRLGVVGIGGYLVQGGLSFLSAQHGMAGDSIVEFETVLANGTIANINMNNHPDLVVAMRGGGDQFGIVTKFTLKAYPIGQVWGGIRLYTGDRAKIYDALHDFIQNNDKDPKAAIIFTVSPGIPGLDTLSSLGSLFSGGSSLLSGLSGLFGGSSAKGTPKGSSTPKGSAPKGSAKGAPKGSVPKGFGFGTVRDASESNAEEAAQASSSAYMVMLCYDGPNPPKGAFGKFEDIKPMIESVKTQSYADLIGMSDTLFNYFSMRTSFRSISLPLLPNNSGYYVQIEDMWNNITASMGKNAKGTMQSTIAVQPFSRAIGKATAQRGGNAMGLTDKDHDRFILEIAGIYNNKADDDLAQQMGIEFTKQLTQQLNSLKANAKTAGAIGEYNPWFMNDAGPDQDVMATYRDVKKFAALQKEVDPQGLFSKRAGGYKFNV